MSTDLYPYIKGELFKSPNTYMYTPFHGHPFLDTYREVRIATIDKLQSRIISPDTTEWKAIALLLANSNPLQLNDFLTTISNTIGAFEPEVVWPKSEPVISQFIEAGDVDTKALLDALLGLRALGKSKRANYALLVEQLRRVFERKRLIYERYTKKMRVGSGEVNDVGLYARLGCLFSLELNNVNINLRIANALLKVNDIICSVSSKLQTDLDRALAYVSLNRELEYITLLRKQCGGLT